VNRVPAGVAISTAADLGAVKRLLGSCRLPVGDIGDGQLFVIARAGGELCATAGLEPLGTVALLRSVAVHPAWRGKGIAHALCGELMRRARAMNLIRLFLITTDAPRFFAGLGFEAVDRDSVPAEIASTAQFRELCPQSAIVMARDL
jgi:amino-acid N-acetyltransferase